MDEIQTLLNTANENLNKFRSKGVKASGQRARAALLSIKKKCDLMRKEIMEESKTMPAKKLKTSKPSAGEEEPAAE